jgi:hypothetical protein
VTSLLADFALTTSVIASLPDLRGVTTVGLTVDHLALPADDRLAGVAVHGDGVRRRPSRSTPPASLHDERGRQVAAVSGWFLAAAAEAASAERVGLAHEPTAAHLLDLLGVPVGRASTLAARDALSNALGTRTAGSGRWQRSSPPRPPRGRASAR